MRTYLIITVLLCVVIMNVRSLHAQRGRKGVGAWLVPGIAYEGARFGDQTWKSHSEFGFTIGGQIWAPLSNSVAVVLEGSLQPNRLENPVIDEAFRAFYLQVGPEISFGRSYLRPSLGLVWRIWSYKQRYEETETGFVLGIAFGRERSLGNRFHMSPELIVRLSVAEGLATWVLGLQVPFGRRSRTGHN